MSNASSAPHPLIYRKFRMWILLACGVILYFFANFQRVGIPGSIFNELQSELAVSASKITAMGSAFMYIYAAMQLIAGLLVDRYGGYRVISFGAFLFCAGSLMFPFSDTLFMLYMSRATVGLGAGTIYLSMVKEIARSSSKNFALLAGVLILIGYSGGIMANAPFVASAHAIGWRMSLKLAAAATALAYVFFLIFRFTLKMPKIQNVSFSPAPFIEFCRKKHNVRLALAVAFSFGTYYVYQTVIGKKFLEDYCRMDSESAGWALTLLGVLAAVFSFLCALFSRLAGNRRKPFIIMGGSAALVSCLVILFALVLDIRSPALSISMFCLAAMTNFAPVSLAAIKETNDSKIFGVGASFLNGMAYLMVAVYGNLVGFLMDRFPPVKASGGEIIYGRSSYLAVFTALSIFAIVPLVCALRLRETNGSRIEVE